MFGAVVSRSLQIIAPRMAEDRAQLLRRRRISQRGELALGTAMAAALSCFGLAGQARAQSVDACGPLDASGSVTCTRAGNPFADGIAYRTPLSAPSDPASAPLDLHVNLTGDVAMVLPEVAFAVPAIGLSGTGDASVTLLAAEGSSVVTQGAGQTGLEVRTLAGDITVVAPDILATGGRGIDLASAQGAIDLTARAVLTAGDYSRAIDARSLDGGAVSVSAQGPVVTYGDFSAGIVAGARITPDNQSGSITVNAGAIGTTGYGSDGVIVRGTDASVHLDGPVTTLGDSSYGAFVQATEGSAAIVVGDAIVTTGLFSTGIRVMAAGDVSITGGSVSTYGPLASAVAAQSDSGDIVVDLASVHTASTGFSGSFGVSASASEGDVLVRVADASTAAGGVRTLSAFSTYGDARIESSDTVSASGDQAVAVDVGASNGTASVSVKDVAVTGYSATAIVADGNTVDVMVNGTVSASGGGRGDDFAIRLSGEREYIPAPVEIGLGAEPVQAGGFAETGGNIMLVNNGRIEASGGGMGAISANTLGTVTVSGNGNVVASGDGVTGVQIRAGEDVSVAMAALTIAGQGATGIRVDTPGAAIVALDGLEVTGAGVTGVQIVGTGTTDATVTVGTGTVTGARARGILVQTGAYELPNDSVINFDRISANGSAASAVRVEGESFGTISITGGTVDVTGRGASGIDVAAPYTDSLVIHLDEARNSGDFSSGVIVRRGLYSYGNIDIHVDSVNATGNTANGVFVSDATGYGEIGIAAGTVAASGDDVIGIGVFSRNSNVTMAADTVEAHGARAIGILAKGENVSVDVSGSMSVSGTASRAVSVFGNGTATVNVAGPIEVDGDLATALDVQALGDVELTAGAIELKGDGGKAVGVESDGNVTARIASVHADTQGGSVLNAVSFLGIGKVDVTIGDVALSGFGFNALYVRSRDDDANLTVGGTIQTDNAGGIFVDADRGTARASVNNLIINGANFGASSSPAMVLVGTNAELTINGTLLDTTNYLNDLDTPYNVSTAVNATGNSEEGQGNATIVNNGLVDARAAKLSGLTVTAWNNATVSGSGAISTIGTFSGGLRVMANGDVSVEQGSITTLGYGSAALKITDSPQRQPGEPLDSAGAIGGDLFVNVGTLSTQGDISDALSANVAGDADVTVKTASTAGLSSAGISLDVGGSVTLGVETVSATGAGGTTAVRVQAGKDAAIELGTLVSGGRGIQASAFGNLVLAANSVSSAGFAVTALSDGDLDLSFGDVSSQLDRAWGVRASGGDIGLIAGSVATEGVNSRGVWAMSAGDVDVAVGSLTTLGDLSEGINVSSGGAAHIAVETLSTQGANANGAVVASTGTATVLVGDVSVGGADAVAIRASSLAQGEAPDPSGGEPAAAVSILAGHVVASGDSTTEAALAAVIAQSSGSANVAVGSVLATGTNRDGVAILAQGTGSLTILSGGEVQATHDAVTFVSGEGAVLLNGGAIIGGTVAGSGGAAVRAEGGPATIVNLGTISGALVLGDGDDGIVNAGLLRLTTGTTLGGGDDTLANGGTLLLAGDIDFGEGSDVLANAGTVRLEGDSADGAAMPARLAALAVPAATSRTILGLEAFENTGLVDLANGVAGDTLTLSGNFSGSGASTLAVDVAFGPVPVADRLVIEGAATGTTQVAIVTTGAPELGVGPVVVQASAGTSAGAFVLEPAQETSGLFVRGLVFDSATDSFSLAVAPSTTAYRLLNLGEGAQSLWIESADSVAAHMTANREAGVTGSGFWFSALGGVSRRGNAGVFTAFGLDHAADIGYRQDVFGAQMGVDLGSGPIGFGVTGGYASSAMTFAGSADRATFDAWNIGAYASLVRGPLFANVLVKYDGYGIDARLPSADVDSRRIRGEAYGARAEAGFSIGSAAVRIEPVASVSWQHVSIDPLDLPLSVDFEDLKGGRASAGLRLRSTREIGGSARLDLYAQGDFVQPFGGAAAVTFSTANAAVAIEGDRIGAYGKGRIGLSVTRGPVTGYIEGDGRFSDAYRGGGGKVGLRVAF